MTLWIYLFLSILNYLNKQSLKMICYPLQKIYSLKGINKNFFFRNISYSSYSKFLDTELVDLFEKNRNFLSTVSLLNDSYNFSIN